MKNLFNKKSVKKRTLQGSEHLDTLKQILESNHTINPKTLYFGDPQASFIHLSSSKKNKPVTIQAEELAKTPALYVLDKSSVIIEGDTSQLNFFIPETGELHMTDEKVLNVKDLRIVIADMGADTNLVKNFYYGNLYYFAGLLSKLCPGRFNEGTLFSAQADALMEIYPPNTLRQKMETITKIALIIGRVLKEESPYIQQALFNQKQEAFYAASLCIALDNKLTDLRKVENKIKNWKP